MALKEVHRPGY